VSLKENVEQVRARIENAQQRSGNTNPVEIVAITKTHSHQIIGDVVKAGLQTIGENRIQEAEEKFSNVLDLLPKITKRLVGHLQSNKINKALQLFDAIDSIDSLKLAKKLGDKIKQKDQKIPVLLEVNTSGESAKFGFEPSNIENLLACFDIEGIVIKGLMTIGPLTPIEKEIRNAFRTLRRLSDSINSQIGRDKAIKELSMGMSGDFEIAVEEGSTMVRLGTILFGPRNVSQ
jgi:pyridoxal phosphate enzyme (YggS family)